MKKSFTLLCLVLVLYSVAGAESVLAFKENKNQWDKRVLFATDLQNGAIFLSQDSFTFVMADTADMARIRRAHHPWMYNPNLDLGIRVHVFRQIFEGANANCKVTGSRKLNEYYNYYIGKDPSKWAPHVNGYYDIAYQNLYNDIDLQVTSQGVNMKYSFIVKPGADPAAIAMGYVGADGIHLNDGNLVINTSIGDVVDTRPYAYQLIGGKQQPVNCAYELKDSKVRFILPDGYNKSVELVIDPTLIFSTFSGSTADNFGYSATYDGQGNAYAAGSVFQYTGHYPTTPGAFQTSWAGGIGFGNVGQYDGTGTDVSITKYDSLGHTRIYSTYLGGDHDELPHSLIVNSNDELFVLGSTSSNNFPVTATAFDTTFHSGPDMGVFNGIGIHYLNGSDIFIARFNQNGTALLGSTYVGGKDNDGLTYPEYIGLNYNYADEVRGEINIDQNDNVYVATTTRSADFPVTPGAYQTVKGDSSDGVLFKMDDNMTHMIWSTFLGGNDADAIYSLDFDPNGDIYVAGGTRSDDFPHTTDVVQTVNKGGRAEGFITHISKNGNAILQSTFYGSPEYDQVYFVRTDKSGKVYAFGQTEALDSSFIHNAGYYKLHSGQFISKFTPALDTVIWSTTFGSGKGTPDISPTAFLVDVCNKAYISGWGSNFFLAYNIVGSPPLTTGGLDVTANAYQATTDSEDFYIMVMKDDASALSYATFIGSSNDEEHVDGGTSRFDRKGVIYQSVCAGCNGKSTFPTTVGAVSQTNNSANCNNAVFKMDFNLPLVIADFKTPPTGCSPDTVSFTNRSQSVLNPSYSWNFGDGSTSSQFAPSHIYTHSGLYNVQLVVSDPGSCNGTDTLNKQVFILSNGSFDTIPTVAVCSGQSAQIGIAPSYDSSITYLWIPSNTLNQNNIANPFASPTQPTTYLLLVSNGLCVDTFRQLVNIDSNAFTLSGGALLCAGDTLTLSAINSEPGQQFTYNWHPVGRIISGASTATPLVSPLQTTVYTVIATNQIGCVYTDSVAVSVTSNLPSVHAYAVPDTIKYGDTAQLNLTLSSNVSMINWQPDSSLSATTIADPKADPKQTDTYLVVVTDSVSCKRTDTVTVYVIRTPCAQSNIYIPDAFSPNADGKNDVLYVRGNDITNLDFAVYDRWGQKVFESKDITNGWDGTYKGKKMDSAVFAYYAKGTCATGEKFLKKGNVTILK